MRKGNIISQVGLALLLLSTLVPPAAAQAPGGFNAPEGFIPPPLNPTGVRLQTKDLAAGVYALLSGRPGVDNNGFVVGERGVR